MTRKRRVLMRRKWDIKTRADKIMDRDYLRALAAGGGTKSYQRTMLTNRNTGDSNSGNSDKLASLPNETHQPN